MNYVIGIDPGKNGGIVALSGTKVPKVIDIIPMPITISSKWDHFLYLGFPNNLKSEEDTYVFIEDVHSMPTDGVRSAFSFGRHLGHLDVILDRLCYRSTISRVKPRTWMDTFDLKRDKEAQESSYQYKKRILETSKRYIKKGSKESKFNKELTLKTCDAYMIALFGFNSLTRSSK